MKTLDFKLILSMLLMLSLTVGCKKDALVKSDIRDTEQSTVPDDDDAIHTFIDGDIRVLKVEYDYKGGGGVGHVSYEYDNDNKLTKIYGDGHTANVSYEDKMLKIQGDSTIPHQWNFTNIHHKSDGRVEIVNVSTPGFSYPYLSYVGELLFSTNSQNMFAEISMDKPSTYYPLLSKVNSYNNHGLPETSVYIPNIGDSFYPKDTLNYVEFHFEYLKGEDIPYKLIRLINEELLHLNKYGITNYDIGNISGDTNPLQNKFSEGNWLISFGLSQYYILEEKSTHLVSKRTTDIYKINETGEKEYERTITEDFPYVHDAKARTLEIAGLKIWYEYVE